MVAIPFVLNLKTLTLRIISVRLKIYLIKLVEISKFRVIGLFCNKYININCLCSVIEITNRLFKDLSKVSWCFFILSHKPIGMK